MILLNVQEVTKHFGPEPVLDRVSFEVHSGDKIGLVGPNGAGKSTLLKILAGELDLDGGRLDLHASARLEYLEQHPIMVPGRTLWEEASTAMVELVQLSHTAEEVAHALSASQDPAERARLGQQFDRLQHELQQRDAYNLDHKIERVLHGLGFDESAYTQPIELLSGGQQNRLMLAKLLLRDPDLMLLDEPSNHLDIEATEWLEGFLAASQRAMIVVSHDRYFLDKVTGRTLELFHGEVDDYTGNFSAYWRQKAERLEVEQRAFEKQQEFIAKTEDFIRRNHYGQGHGQAEDRKKKLARVERIRPPRKIEAPPMGFAPATRTGDIVLRAEHMSKAYARPLFSDLSFDILRGERWGIVGPNGSGKTTLLRCLVGQVAADAGQSHLGTGVRPGYYDQLLSGLSESDQVVDAIRPPGKEYNEPQRRAMLARFGLVGEAVFQRVGSLSGGERSRAALAQLAASDANFLILDEPTNHLDLWALDALERSLNAFNGTVLFVSHDRYFLNRVADHVLVVEPSRFRVIEGNYDTYLHLVKQGLAGEASPRAAEKAAAKVTAKKSAATEGAAKPKRKFPYRKVADLEADIMELESRLEELQATLVSPDVLRNGQRVREVQAEINQRQSELATLYEHYEEATLLN